MRNVKKYTAATFNAKLSALMKWNTYLTQDETQAELVITDKDFMKIQAPVTSPNEFEREDMEALRQSLLVSFGVRDYAIATVMIYGGLRVSEVVNLTLSDLLWDVDQIHVCGKGNKERFVIMNDIIKNAICEYLKERPHSKLAYVFISRKHGKLSRQWVTTKLKKCMGNVNSHKLRHFFCSHAIDVGYTLPEVAAQAGHKNIHTTQRYVHPSARQLMEKANRL